MPERYCTFCGGHNHTIETCPHTWDGSAKRAWGLHCGYCGSNKHSTSYCPKTWAGPSNRLKNPHGDFID